MTDSVGCACKQALGSYAENDLGEAAEEKKLSEDDLLNEVHYLLKRIDETFVDSQQHRQILADVRKYVLRHKLRER